ncbi:MAG TPA: hypothetical protein VE861_09380 [Gemmatimonadaceae bacterium]|nr:hypothetical protein [Gemmatimonadaceae bacterium]
MRTVSRGLTLRVTGVTLMLTPALLLLGGCAKRQQADGAPTPEPAAESGSTFVQDVPLRIENRFYGDVVVSIERGGLRTRLATVTGSTTRELTIPKRYFEVIAPVRLIAEGMGAGSGAQRVTTNTGNLVVRAGQRIVWMLETQLERSTVGVY